MNWFHFTLLSTILLVSYVFLSKIFLSHPSTNPKIYGGLVQLFAGLWCLPVLFFIGFNFHPPLHDVWLLIPVTLLYVISATLYYSGLQKVELSKTAILSTTSIFWAGLYGLLIFSEPVTTQKIFASLLVFSAVWIVSGKFNILKWSKYEFYLLIAPSLSTLAVALDKHLVQFSNTITYVSLAFFLPGLVMSAVNIFPAWDQIKLQFQKINFWKFLLINSGVVSAAYVIQYQAFQVGGEISRMFPIVQSEAVILPVLGVAFLREKRELVKKIISLVLVIIAFYLIRP